MREKRGPAYGVDGYFAPAKRAGPFGMSACRPRRRRPTKALALVRKVLAQYVAEGPTDAELKAAKDNLINGFPLRIDSNASC
ncbi:insulinase family protein [Cupriavidus basilensis]